MLSTFKADVQIVVNVPLPDFSLTIKNLINQHFVVVAL